jgi:hypothetical protein
MVEYLPDTHEIIINKNDFLKFGNGYYKYIGKVNNIHEVPNSNCLYRIDDYLYIRRIDLRKLNALKHIDKPAKEVDDSDELDLEVKPGDDSTLVIVKSLLKGFTKNSFRKLFDNDSDMNNMRRAIEKSPNGELSLRRFRTILDKLNLKYKFIIFSEDLNNNNPELDSKIEKINKGMIDLGDENKEEPEEVEDNE